MAPCSKTTARHPANPPPAGRSQYPGPCHARPEFPRSLERLAGKLVKYQLSSGSTPYRETLTTLLSTIQAGKENRLSLEQVKHDAPERNIEIGQLVPHLRFARFQAKRSRPSSVMANRRCWFS